MNDDLVYWLIQKERNPDFWKNLKQLKRTKVTSSDFWRVWLLKIMKSCFQIGDYCFIYPECQGFKPDPKITLVITLLIPSENGSILTVSVHSVILWIHERLPLGVQVMTVGFFTWISIKIGRKNGFSQRKILNKVR